MSDGRAMHHPHSAGGIVVNPRGQIAIVNQGEDFWSLPKGHVRPDETVLAAARREIHEETGLTGLRLIKKLGSYQRPEIKDGQEDLSSLKTITLYLFTTTQQGLHPVETATVEATWIKPHELGRLLSHPADRAYALRVLPHIESLLAPHH